MPGVRPSLPKIDNYPDYLEKCWQLHLKEREPNAPTVISTFAGCGGSSLGYSMAGLRELLAIEWDDNAVETFKLNFPDISVYHGDIAKISVDQIFEMTGLHKFELDVFDGSPPCQGFSMAGKRIFDDGRNQLFKEYIRLLDGLQPKVFVMENVPGMVQGKMKLIFAEILKELKACGYKVKAKVLNAMYFGVPQSRKRLIFIGVREDLVNKPSHPEAKYRPITFKEATKDLNDYTDRKLPDFLVEYGKLHPGGWTTNKELYKSIKGNLAGSISLNWASYNKSIGTLTKSEISVTGIVHPNCRRYLNLSEAARLTSYPDEFKFIDRKNRWARIGNSVPPLFMMEIAKHIKNYML